MAIAERVRLGVRWLGLQLGVKAVSIRMRVRLSRRSGAVTLGVTGFRRWWASEGDRHAAVARCWRVVCRYYRVKHNINLTLPGPIKILQPGRG